MLIPTPPLTPEHQTLINDRNTQIGNICVQWAHIESQLSITIWALLHLDDATGKLVTGGLDMMARVSMALRLAQHLRAPGLLIAAIKKVRTELQTGLLEKRNLVVHGQRNLDFNNTTVEYFEVHRGKSAGIKQSLTNAQLHEIGMKLYWIGIEYYAVLFAQGVLTTQKGKPERIIALRPEMNAASSESTDKS